MTSSPTNRLRQLDAWLDPGTAPLTGRQLFTLAAVWAAGSLLLLLGRPGYFFPPYGALDGWIYTAYQWDFRGQVADFGPTYYGSRLSWVLPGAIFHYFLPLFTANITYKLLVSAAFAAAGAAIVYRTLGFGAALVMVALSVFSPQVILALHTDYIDTAVFVYAAVALACITAAKDSPRWPWLIFLGGCAYAGMVIANLSALASLGAGVAVYHLVWLRWGFLRQAACVGLYLAAAGFVCVALGFAHRAAGGEFNFLQPQIGMLSFMKELKDNPWIPKDPLWFTRAPWLLLTAGTLLWGTHCSLVNPPAEERARQLLRSLTAGLAVSFLLAVILQVRQLNATLSFSFYASFHLSLALPLLVACWKCSADSRPGAGAWVLGSALALGVIALAWTPLPATRWLAGCLPFIGAPRAVPFVLTGFLLVASALAAFVSRRRPGGLPAWLRPEILLVGLFTASMSIDFHGPALSDRLRERYQAVHAAYRVLAREFTPGSYRFWVDPSLEHDGVSLASTKLWAFRLFTLQRFPECEPNDFVKLGENLTLVVPSPPGRGQETIATATRVLKQANYIPANPRVIPVPGEKGTGFDLVCFSVHAIPLDPGASGLGSAPATACLDLDFSSSPPYTATLGENYYGAVTGRALDTSRGYPVFTRTDARDHLATPFKELHVAPAGTPRQLSLVATMPADGHCIGVIQVDDCETIAQVTWTRPGRFVHTITAPPGAKVIRLYLQAGTDQPTPLPTRITLYERLPDAGTTR